MSEMSGTLSNVYGHHELLCTPGIFDAYYGWAALCDEMSQGIPRIMLIPAEMYSLSDCSAQLIPAMFDYVQVCAACWPRIQLDYLLLLEKSIHNSGSMWSGVIIHERGYMGMILSIWHHNRTQYLINITLSIHVSLHKHQIPRIRIPPQTITLPPAPWRRGWIQFAAKRSPRRRRTRIWPSLSNMRNRDAPLYFIDCKGLPQYTLE